MEEKPIFKFKASKVIIGGIDANGSSEWELLVKNDTNDLPKFLHFQKMWIQEETPDEVDENGQIFKQGIKKIPVVKVFQGFIKEEKFVVTNQSTLSAMNFHDVYKKFKKNLEFQINENGYKKDESRYLGEFGQPQQYYANERTPMIPTMTAQDAFNMVQTAASTTSSTTGGQNPHVQIIPKKKGLTNLLSSISNLQQNP